MLILIHGDDIVASRKALNELKTKYVSYEQIIFEGSRISLTDIITAADSLSLFSTGKFIIIENLLSGPMSKAKEEILDFISSGKMQTTVVFCEQKEIGKLIVKKYFSQANIISCQLPAILFRFLDAIGSKPPRQILSMFHTLAAERDGEFLLSMLIRQWRFLIIAADLGEKGFSGMPPWQAFKFINQARFFDLPKLISSYRQLLSFDMRVKSGLTPYSLNQLLDIFFVSL